ncbi:hypothetical protein ACOSP7_018871 [Xanthoceras sorbifolium]
MARETKNSIGGFRGRGRGRGRGRVVGHDEQRRSFGENRSYKNGVQCHYCKKFGHIEANCWSKEKQAHYIEERQEESKLFMTHLNVDALNDIWFLDSGCSNHMSGIKSTFKELDESYKVQVKLGDNKQIQVEGKEMVAIKTGNNGVKFLHNVFFVPSLAHNLLSVGKLITAGHLKVFGCIACALVNSQSRYKLDGKSEKCIFIGYRPQSKAYRL